MKVIKSNDSKKTNKNQKSSKNKFKEKIKNQIDCLNHTGCPTDGDNLDCGGVITH